MPLNNRFYLCPDCGNFQDRDLNAARNIERWFDGIFIPKRSDMAVSSNASACGVDKPDNSHVVATVKQEVNTKITHVQLSRDLVALGQYGLLRIVLREERSNLRIYFSSGFTLRAVYQ